MSTFLQIQLIREYIQPKCLPVPAGSIGKVIGTNLKDKKSIVQFAKGVIPGEETTLWKGGVSIRVIPWTFYKPIGRTE